LKVGNFHGDSSREKIASHNVGKPNVGSYGRGGGLFKPSNFKQGNLLAQQLGFCYNCGKSDHWHRECPLPRSYATRMLQSQKHVNLVEEEQLVKGVKEEIVEMNEKDVPNVFYVALISRKIHQYN
jgi:hypothetical protein